MKNRQKKPLKTEDTMKFIFAFLVLCFVPLTSAAADYKPGSAGYLYENCKEILAKAENLKMAHDSYCGAFIEGYFMGVMASGSLKLPMPSEDDPCFEDKTREYTRINERFCTKLPTYQSKQDTPESLIRQIVDTIELWKNKNETNLDKPAINYLSELLQPGKLCDSLPAPKSDVEISSALLKLGWADIFSVKKLVSHQKKYDQCVSDIEEFGDSPTAFKGSRCGAEVSGFITGLHASDHLDAPIKQPAEQCTKQIERLYNSVNPRETMCVKKTTHPLYVARVYVENYALIRGNPGLLNGIDLFDPGALGAVGYETIYRGFMCRNEAEKRAKQ